MSNDSNNVLRYDRSTGEFLGVSASGDVNGFSEPRGLMFSLRPFTFITASSVVTKKGKEERDTESERKFTPIEVDFITVKGKLDSNSIVELVSIEVNDVYSDVSDDVKGAKFGKDDRRFLLRTDNDSDSDRVYTITYRVSNVGEGTVIATTKYIVPSIEE